jgi:hypothetical protein
VSVSSYDPRFNPPYEPDLPVTAEGKLEDFQAELEKARQVLREARDAEVTAKLARDKAARAARFSPDCPKAGVFDGERVTVADKEAWIAAQVEEQEQAYQLARTARQAASDHLHTLGKQGGFQQSIAASVREAFRGTGRMP